MEGKKKPKESPLSPAFLRAIKDAIYAHGGQAAVSEKTGLAQSQISRFLGGRDVRVSTLMRLLAALGGGIGSVEGKALPMVAEAPAAFQAELLQAKMDLAKQAMETARVSQAMAEQQNKILNAVTLVCREQALTEAQAHALQAAVASYESVLAGTHRVGFTSPTSAVLRHASSE